MDDNDKESLCEVCKTFPKFGDFSLPFLSSYNCKSCGDQEIFCHDVCFSALQVLDGELGPGCVECILCEVQKEYSKHPDYFGYEDSAKHLQEHSKDCQNDRAFKPIAGLAVNRASKVPKPVDKFIERIISKNLVLDVNEVALSNIEQYTKKVRVCGFEFNVNDKDTDFIKNFSKELYEKYPICCKREACFKLVNEVLGQCSLDTLMKVKYKCY